MIESVKSEESEKKVQSGDSQVSVPAGATTSNSCLAQTFYTENAVKNRSDTGHVNRKYTHWVFIHKTVCALSRQLL